MSTVHKIIYSCEEATQLIVKKADVKLTLVQRIRIWIHLQMCDACKRFNIQNAWIDKQIHKMAHRPEEIKLSAEQKNRIAERLKTDL
jgi:predicted anti-sigma-YlaC factor YlaD